MTPEERKAETNDPITVETLIPVPATTVSAVIPAPVTVVTVVVAVEPTIIATGVATLQRRCNNRRARR